MPVPKMSPECVGGDHDDCAHWAAFGMSGTLGRGASMERTVWLCACTSHDACPLHGLEDTPEATWRSTCTCTAAPAEWDRLDQIMAKFEQNKAKRAARREEDRKVLREVTIGPGATRSSIRSELTEALARHRVEWSPNKIEATIDTLTATTGNRWLVAPRALIAIRRAARRSRPKA